MDGSAPLLVDCKQLKELRRKAGLSQEALAEACQQRRIPVSIATIKRAEGGKSVGPRTLSSLADFYGVAVDSLLVSAVEPESPSSSDCPEPQTRACLVLVVKFSTAKQKEYLTRMIGQAAPVLVDIHGSYILAGFRSGFSSETGKINPVLALCHQLQQTAQQSSVVSPIFSLVTFAYLQESERGYFAERALLNQFAERIRLLPSNQLVCCDAFRQLYARAFEFSSVSIAAPVPYWVVEPDLKQSEPLVTCYGAEIELARITALQSQAIAGHRCFSALVLASAGTGKSHFLHVLSHQVETPFNVICIDLQRGDEAWRLAMQQVNSMFQQNMQGASGVLLLVDNVHFASSEQRETLSLLRRQFIESPLVIVISCDESRYEFMTDLFPVDLTVHLSPMSEQDGLQLSQQYAGVSDQKRREYIQRSGGNPLFLKLLLGQPERDANLLPVTLQWLFWQQFTVLASQEQQIVSWLAHAGTPLSRLQLEMLLQQPLAVDVISSFKHVQLLSAGLFALKVPLLGEAVLAEQAGVSRRTFHLQLAEMGAKTVDEESIEQNRWVADQFDKAGERGSQLRYLSIVIGLLIQKGEYDAAELAVTTALKLHMTWTPDDSQLNARSELTVPAMRMELLTHHVNICKVLYGWDSPVVSDLYHQMQALSELTGDTRYRVAGLFGVWSTTLIRLDLTQAMDYAGEALLLAQQNNDIPGQIQALSAQSNTVFWMGDMQKAYELSCQAVSLYPVTGLADPLLINGQDPRMLGLCFRVLSAASLELGNTPQFLQEMLYVSEETNHPFSKAIALQGAAWYYWIIREPELAKHYASQLRELATEHSFPFYKGMAALFEGWADYQMSGDIAHLETVGSGFQRWLSSTAHKLLHSLYAVIAADILISDNQHTLARELLTEAMRELDVKGAHSYLPEMCRLMSRVDSDSGAWLSRALDIQFISPLDRYRVLEEYRLWIKS